MGKLQQNIKDLAGILWTESSVWLKSLGKKVCDASVKLFGKAPEFCASLKAFDTWQWKNTDHGKTNRKYLIKEGINTKI